MTNPSASSAAESQSLDLDIPSASLAESLEEALASSTRAPLEAMHSQIGDLFMRTLSTAPDSVRRVSRTAGAHDDGPEGLEIRVAMRLGELRFAHLMAAQVGRRASDDFVPLLTTGVSGRIAFLVMKHETLDRQAMADHLKEPLLQVSNNVTRMVEEGILEFRRRATGVRSREFFLTAPARQFLSSLVSRDSIQA